MPGPWGSKVFGVSRGVGTEVSRAFFVGHIKGFSLHYGPGEPQKGLEQETSLERFCLPLGGEWTRCWCRRGQDAS